MHDPRPRIDTRLFAAWIALALPSLARAQAPSTWTELQLPNSVTAGNIAQRGKVLAYREGNVLHGYSGDREGYRALPSLIKRLDEEEGIEARARILAMLTSITGRGYAGSWGRCAWGAANAVEVHVQPDHRTSFRPGNGAPSCDIDAQAQEEAISTWGRLRRFVKVVRKD